MRYSYVEPASDLQRSATLALPVPAYRILTPAPPSARNPLATPSQLPAGARTLLTAAKAVPGQRAAATYALALEVATGNQVHSVAVRVDTPGRGRGAAIWINDVFDNALWMAPEVGLTRVRTQAEFRALATDRVYVPPAPRAAPVKSPCPRCDVEVRWRFIEQSPFTLAFTYAHNRTEMRGEGGQVAKVPCT